MGTGGRARYGKGLVAGVALAAIAAAVDPRAHAEVAVTYTGEAGYSSNADQYPGGRTSPFHSGDLLITATSGGDKPFVDFALRGSYETLPRARDLDRRSVEATLALRGALSETSAVTLEATAGYDDDEGLVTQTGRVVLRGEHGIGRLTLEPAVQIERKRFGDYDLGFDILLPGEDRDRLDLTAELALRADLGGGFALAPVASFGRRLPDLATDIFGRKRGSETLFAGIEAGYTGSFTASVTLGRIMRRYDEEVFSDVNAFALDAEAAIPVGTNGRVEAGLMTRLEDDDLFLAKDVLTRSAAGRYRHRVWDGVFAEAGYDAEWSRYLQFGVSSLTHPVTTAVERRMTPTAALRLAVSHAWARSYPEGGDTGREWRVGLGLVARIAQNDGGR